jgi:hypothetical protein
LSGTGGRFWPFLATPPAPGICGEREKKILSERGGDGRFSATKQSVTLCAVAPPPESPPSFALIGAHSLVLHRTYSHLDANQPYLLLSLSTVIIIIIIIIIVIIIFVVMVMPVTMCSFCFVFLYFHGWRHLARKDAVGKKDI